MFATTTSGPTGRDVSITVLRSSSETKTARRPLSMPAKAQEVKHAAAWGGLYRECITLDLYRKRPGGQTRSSRTRRGPGRFGDLRRWGAQVTPGFTSSGLLIIVAAIRFRLAARTIRAVSGISEGLIAFL